MDTESWVKQRTQHYLISHSFIEQTNPVLDNFVRNICAPLKAAVKPDEVEPLFKWAGASFKNILAFGQLEHVLCVSFGVAADAGATTANSFIFVSDKVRSCNTMKPNALIWPLKMTVTSL